MIAALGNLQVRVVARREANALRRHQVQKRVVRRGQVLVHRIHHLVEGVGAGNLQHLRVALQNLLRAGAQAAGHHHLAILAQRLANGIEALVDGIVDEAAGVHYHQVGLVVGAHHLIALGAQPGEDLLAVAGGLGAAEADKPDSRDDPCCAYPVSFAHATALRENARPRQRLHRVR